MTKYILRGVNIKLGVFAVIFGDKSFNEALDADKGLGIQTIGHAVKSIIRVKNTFYPDKTKVGIYAEKLNTYKKIYWVLKEINASI